jgi:voltage-gated potassium channel
MPLRLTPVLGQRLTALIEDPIRRFQFSLLVLLLLLAGGTMGYMTLERMDFIDALYMTTITVATVGFSEVHPLSHVGKIYTIGLIVLGVGAAAWAISSGIEIVLDRKLWHTVQRRNLERHLMKLENHYIICGYGRIGRQIVRDLQARAIPYVVIDSQADLEQELLDENVAHIMGDATLDEVLQRGGITRAQGLVAAINSDAGNVLTVLSARGLNPDLLIVARAMNEASERKLIRAGANRVVSPYSIGGHRLALALLQPSVDDFFQQVFNLEDLTADIGQVAVHEGSPLAGQTIGDSDLRKIWNLTILAVRHADGSFTTSPDASHRLQPEETLIVIGNPTAIYQLAVEQKKPARRSR